MSNAAGAPSNGTNAGVKSPERRDKGKGKNVVASPDVSMEEDEDEEDSDEDEDGDEAMEEDEEEDDDDDDSIDPSAIIRTSGRTRGVRVDYTSKEALEKAGLKPESEDDEDDEEMKR